MSYCDQPVRRAPSLMVRDISANQGYPPIIFLSTFPTFSSFSGPITVIIDTLWGEFSTDHFETMHTCST